MMSILKVEALANPGEYFFYLYSIIFHYTQCANSRYYLLRVQSVASRKYTRNS